MNKKIIIISITLTLLLSIGLTLAYYIGTIEGTPHQFVYTQNLDFKIIFEKSLDLDEDVTPGWETSRTFTVESQNVSKFTYNIVFKDLINTFETDLLEYKITSTDGGYNMKNYKPIPKSASEHDVVIIPNIEIEAKASHTYTINFRYLDSPTINQAGDVDENISLNIYITEGRDYYKSLAGRLLVDNELKGIRGENNAPFTDIVGTEELSGLYQESGNFTEDMDGDGEGEVVYYFVGDVKNNWVKFGKEGEDDIWWRIIRTNEDGSVRLLYAGKGEEGHATEFGYINATQKNDTNARSSYNTTHINTMYVGYMYGSSGNTLTENRKNDIDSEIKKSVDNWYIANLTGTYGNYLSKTAIYCNDRATTKYAASGTMNYAGYYRLQNAKRPSFKCGNDQTGNLYQNADNADKFTGSNKKNIGNGKLGDAPIALMTADEVVYAGGIYGSKNENTYYYQNSNGGSITGTYGWWTMSPYNTDSNSSALIFSVIGSDSDKLGDLTSNHVHFSLAVRPVLSLKSCIEVTGKGTVDDPYIPDPISEACALADN